MSSQAQPDPPPSDQAQAPALRALVVYESMFGSTQDVAAAVADGLRAEGLVTQLVDVRHAPAPRDAQFDLLVVGAPTHAFSLSRPSTRQDAVRQGAAPELASTGVREWIGEMGSREESRGRAAAAFDTRVTKVRSLPKAASTRASHLLARRGYHLVSRPTPFLVHDVKGPLVAGELEHAVTWAREVAVAARRWHAENRTAAG
ncbi:flavodoxin family protein [Nocardioides sp.]|uniref:flavodoxin family protein n=1 Tax=Nocardioides sp. TaxID=35761 RepID=UPI0025D33325|nr:flavodoxin family protein [Nocardioides sp.]